MHENLLPRHIGKVQVDNRDVVGIGVQMEKSRLPILRHIHGVELRLEAALDKAGHLRFVFN